MSVHKGITSLESLSEAAGKDGTDLPGAHLIGPACSPAGPIPPFPPQGKWVELCRVGVRPPCVGSEGSELTVQVEKDMGRSRGPSPFPVNSKIIGQPCFPSFHFPLTSFKRWEEPLSGSVIGLGQGSVLPSSASPLAERQD